MKRFFLAFAALFGSIAVAESPWQTLPAEECRNGATTLLPLSGQAADLSGHVYEMVDGANNIQALATRIRRGFALTKATEITKDMKIRVGDAPPAAVTVTKQWPLWDLALITFDEPTDQPEPPALIPLTKGKNRKKAPNIAKVPLGTWLLSPTDAGKGIRIGVISANQRPIPQSKGGMGVQLGRDGEEVGGVELETISANGPADLAGLISGDVIEKIEDTSVNTKKELIEHIGQFRPGDKVVVHLRRQQKTMTIEVELGSFNNLVQNWGAHPEFGGESSSRPDGFPQVIQHDTPLAPNQMGGPLCDLDGRFIGINIARADRVTTFALPWEALAPVVMPHLNRTQK